MKKNHHHLFDHEARRLRAALDSTAGLELRDGYRGRLRCGNRSARVRLESNESIRVALPVKGSRSAVDALAATASLAGNVRFVRAGSALALVADTRVDGAAHLPLSFAEIRRSFCAARKPGAPTAEAAEAIAPAAVERALSTGSFETDAVVTLEDGWEVRPRLGGAVVPVRLTCEPGRLRLRRLVLRRLPAGVRLEAVAEEALRSAGEIRLARLAVDGGELVAESCLHAGQVEADWLAAAAWAVAAAFTHCHRRLRVLAEDERVARHYARMCC